jgi:hypothetical protein
MKDRKVKQVLSRISVGGERINREGKGGQI